jgi:hypothetical protein
MGMLIHPQAYFGFETLRTLRLMDFNTKFILPADIADWRRAEDLICENQRDQREISFVFLLLSFILISL